MGEVGIEIKAKEFEAACKKVFDDYGYLLCILVNEDAFVYDTQEFRRFMGLVSFYLKEDYDSRYKVQDPMPDRMLTEETPIRKLKL